MQPRTALVQAGYRNRFGHPAPEVLQRYAQRQVPVVESARCGAATWSSARPDVVECERDKGALLAAHGALESGAKCAASILIRVCVAFAQPSPKAGA